MRSIPTLVCSLFLALGLSACGGGGGAAGSTGAGAVSVGQPDCDTLPANETTGMSASEFQAAAEVWCLTNDARAQNNLPPLVWGDAAAQAGYLHSVFQRGQGDISHTGSGSSDPGDRLAAEGVQYSTWAENVAVGQPTPTSVVNAWLGSSGHFRNIMSGSVTHVGVGCEQGSGGPYAGPWWTQVFYAP